MYLKIKCAGEIRKCAIEAESISYEDLLKKVIQLFPSLRDIKAENVELAYRDDDNDLISISSEDELRTAIAQASGDTLTLVVTGVTAEAPAPSEDDDDEVGIADLFHGGDLLAGLLAPSLGHPHSHSFFNPPSMFPFHHGHMHGRLHQPSLFESPATFRERLLRAREEELRQQRVYEEKLRQAQLERRKALLEQAKKMREERMKEISENRRKSQDLQRMSSKEAGDGKMAKPGAAAPVIPEFPAGWIVRPIGSWDPVVREGQGFHSTSYGPYGYYAHYGPEDMDTKKSTEEKPSEGMPPEEAEAQAGKQDEPPKEEA